MTTCDPTGTIAVMTDSVDDLPDDIERLKALLLAERSEKARLADQNERLLHMLRQLRRNHFGRKSERLSHGSAQPRP